MQGVKGASVEKDLDMRKFEVEYLPTAVSPQVLEENARNAQEQLQALRLTAQDGTPTVTAILTLGKDTRYWFPGAYIQFVRYAGNEVTDSIVDQKELSGTLPEVILEIDRERITQTLNYGDLPETWRVPEIEQFSAQKTFYDYQQDSLKNAARALYLYYGNEGNDYQPKEPKSANDMGISHLATHWRWQRTAV